MTCCASSGTISASHKNAEKALQSGAPVLVYPGGDWETHRPSWESNKVDFAGRKGFIRLALETGVPIVPVVSVGGQETALFLCRGAGLAQTLRLDKMLAPQGAADLDRAALGPQRRRLRSATSRCRPRSRSRCWRRSTSRKEFGADPDLDEVYDHVTGQMQDALDALASERRFPIIG